MARSLVCNLPGCENSLEGMHPARRFCSDTHRKAAKRKQPTAPTGPVSTAIADRYRDELHTLGVLDKGEAQIVLGMCVQLDNNVVQGAGYVSLSKEVDRRVDLLRLKAARPDSAVTGIRGRVEQKKHLRAV